MHFPEYSQQVKNDIVSVQLVFTVQHITCHRFNHAVFSI
jgi:hypothetical protein